MLSAQSSVNSIWLVISTSEWARYVGWKVISFLIISTIHSLRIAVWYRSIHNPLVGTCVCQKFFDDQTAYQNQVGNWAARFPSHRPMSFNTIGENLLPIPMASVHFFALIRCLLVLFLPPTCFSERCDKVLSFVVCFYQPSRIHTTLVWRVDDSRWDTRSNANRSGGHLDHCRQFITGATHTWTLPRR